MYFEGWLTSFCEEDEEIIKLKQKELILPDRSLLKDIDLLLYMNK